MEAPAAAVLIIESFSVRSNPNHFTVIFHAVHGIVDEAVLGCEMATKGCVGGKQVYSGTLGANGKFSGEALHKTAHGTASEHTSLRSKVKLPPCNLPHSVHVSSNPDYILDTAGNG